VAGALERPPALVLVEGEAGIGKTRLIQECLQSGWLSDRTALIAARPPLPESFPLGPVVDGLRRPRECVGDLELTPLGGALRPLFPEWAADLPPPLEPLEDPQATRHRVYRALDELIDRLGIRMLIVEDAHWADPATLEWLLRAGASGDRARSVVVTYRPQDVPSGSPLRQLTSRMPAGMAQVRVALAPLDVAGIKLLVGSMFDTTQVSTEFASFLRERTGGLPLAVEESLRLLQERGDIVRKGGAWARRALTQIRVPPTVRDSVLERVARLDSATRRVLEAAAVVAEPADEALLATVAGLDLEAGRSGVAGGLRAGLLGDAGAGRVAFRHVLAAEAVEEAIPAPGRMRLHRRAGEALEQEEHAPSARLSRHFQEAGEVEAWARYAEAAADQAMESGDDRATVTRLYDLLTSVEHPPPRRARLARKLGVAAGGGATSLIDQAGLVLAALRRVIEDEDIPAGDRGAIRLLLGALLRWHGQKDDSHDQIEAAIPDLADQPGLACRAMLNLAAALSRDWPVQRHLEWIERAAALFPRITSSSERLRAAAIRVTALLALGEEEGWRAAAEFPEPGPSPAEQRTALLSRVDVGRLAIMWGRYAEAGSRLRLAVELIEAAGYERALCAARAGCGYLDWHTGRWSGLAERMAALAGVEEIDHAVIRVEARELQALVELARGARVAAERRLRSALDGFLSDAPLGYQAGTTAGALGRLELATGDAAAALEVTGRVMAGIARKGLWLWSTDVIWVHLDALAAAGEVGRAEDLSDQFEAWLSGRDAPAPAAAGVLCRAIVTEARGDLDRAAGLFAGAAEAWAVLPRPYDELLALERQGRCLLAAGEVDRGLAVLAGARQRLHDLGARWDAGRVARPLRQYRVDVPRPWRSGPRGYGDQLSPREREVMALVAQGMTNRQVGHVLFLSPKTVSRHLSGAMRKLGVSTRTGAAMAAAEAGLAPPDPTGPSA
jgi:DNA-binding CsgD family transcriptional regulator/tetratricopeptide (TPR) repeat protein